MHIVMHIVMFVANVHSFATSMNVCLILVIKHVTSKYSIQDHADVK